MGSQAINSIAMIQNLEQNRPSDEYTDPAKLTSVLDSVQGCRATNRRMGPIGGAVTEGESKDIAKQFLAF